MGHDWLLVETLGDEPAVVAQGRQLKNLVPITTFLRRSRVRFNERFGRIGGEDRRFFLDLFGKGAAFVWAEHAIVDHFVETRRLSWSYILRREFIEDAGAKVELMSASDCLSSTWKDLLPTWRSNKRTWKHLLELEIEACREPGSLDMGTHVLAVAQKPK